MKIDTENKFDLLTPGKIIQNKYLVSEATKGKFSFSKEKDAFPPWVPNCSPGTKFTVQEVCFLPGFRWVKIAPQNTSGITLKITAGEFAALFELI